MKNIKYIPSGLLVIWGLLIAWAKLFFVGIQLPFLTIITIISIFLGISKHKKTGSIFFISACLWIILSAETIGFMIFFDLGNYKRMLVGIFPLLLSIGVLFSTKIGNSSNPSS